MARTKESAQFSSSDTFAWARYLAAMACRDLGKADPSLPEGQFRVKAILGRRRGAGDRWVYRIRFSGYGPEEDRWLPASHIDTGLVREFVFKRTRSSKK
jgi:hypothetical protein